VVHHVHQEQFREHFGPVLSFVGRVSEGLLTRLVYRRAAFAAVSASTRRGVADQLGIARPIVVTPNGADSFGAAFRGPAAAARIVCVARLVPHKQVGVLLDAVSLLVERGSPATLVIVGDGPDRAELEAHAARLGLGARVCFTGHVSAVERDDIVGRASIAALPSSREGWGLTVIEAAAMGVPSVGLRVPGVSDAIVDGQTGWLADPEGGAGALADTLERALDACADPELASWVSRAACVWAASFTWEHTVERLAAAAAIASRRTSERTCIPMVICASDPARVRIDARDEVARCDHGVQILTWASSVAEAGQRAAGYGGSSRPATDAEMHAGPRCVTCVGVPD